MDNKTKLHIIIVKLLDKYEGKYIPETINDLIYENGDIENIGSISQYIHETTGMEPYSYLEKRGLTRNPARASADKKPEAQPEKTVEELAREMAEKMLRDMMQQQGVESVQQVPITSGASKRIPITDPKLQKRVDTLFGRLERLYPEHKVFALDALDKDARKYLSELYSLIGYTTDADFLEAYGYEFITGDEVRVLRDFKVYEPGNEPAIIKSRVESILRRLEEAYPDKIISSSIQNEHRSLNKDVSGVYQWLGYDCAQSMLEAYGFKYSVKAGRPTNDYDAIIQELLEKYKDKPKPKSIGELVFENPEYKGAIKTISNSAQERYGKTAAKYFKEIGLLQESSGASSRQQKPKKPMIEDEARNYLETLYKDLDPNEYGTFEEALEALEGLVVKYKDGSVVVTKCKEERPAISLPFGIDTVGIHAFEGADFLNVVELPDSIKQIRKEAFKGCKNLSSVIVGSSVKTIEDSAFKDCVSLESVELPETLDRIGNSCFEGCVKLEDVTMHNVFTMYGDKAFDGCPFQPENTADEDSTNPDDFEFTKNAKNEITIVKYTGHDRKVIVPVMIGGGMVKTIGKETFNGNNYVQDVVIPDCVSSVQGGAFGNCISLKKVHLSERMSKIVTTTFSGCSALEEVNVPDDVTELKSGTFRHAPLKKLHIGKSLAVINGGSFYEGETDPVTFNLINGSDIQEITINPDNVSLSVEKSMILSGDGKILYSMLGGDRSCVVPEGVEVISDGAFEKQVKLTDVKLPSSLIEIGEKAFRDTSLRSIELPSALTIIGDNAFYRCKHLSSVIFNEGIESIGDYAFYNCPITTVTLPSTLRHLGKYSFDVLSDYCDHKQYIYISDDNENIWADGSAIYSKENGELTLEILYGSSFKDFYYERPYYGDDDEYDEYDDEDYDYRGGDNSSRGYVVEYGTVHIADEACGRCRSLLSIELPDTLRTIGDNAFYYCSGLKEVELPEGVEVIGEGAFRESGLTELAIPSSVKEIGSRAFAINAQTQLKSISVAPNNPVFFTEDGNLYGKNLDGSTNLVVHFGNQEAAVLRDDVIRIQGGSFTNSIVKEIFIPYSVQFVDDKAITGCTKLKRLNIGLKDSNDRYKNAVIYLPKGESDKRDAYGYPDYSENMRLAQIREQYMDCLRMTPSGELFDYAKYDSLFEGVTELDDKILISTDRLKSARNLIPVYEESYRRFLQRNATAAVSTVISDDDVNGLIVLADLDIFNEKNIDQVIEIANKTKKPEVLSYLMNFKNANIGTSSDDYEL